MHVPVWIKMILSSWEISNLQLINSLKQILLISSFTYIINISFIQKSILYSRLFLQFADFHEYYSRLPSSQTTSSDCMIRSQGTNCFRKTAPICALGGLPFNSTAIIRAERCIVGIMAKPFVICHGEETKERDRIALVALICARVYLCRSRALCFHY